MCRSCFVFIEAGSSVDPRPVDPSADTSTESATADSQQSEYLHSRCVFVNNRICSDVVGRYLMCRSCFVFIEAGSSVDPRPVDPSADTSTGSASDDLFAGTFLDASVLDVTVTVYVLYERN